MIDSPEALFAAIVAEQPSRPFVTFYDDATGERSELSAKSLANWVAKTYFLLTDEYALGVGDRALVQLPAHWISVPVLLGAWTAGLTLDVAGDADVAFVEPATAALAAGVPDVVAIAPDTAARGFDGAPPEGTVDYILAVRPQPDAWSSVHAAASASDPAISAQTRGELVAAARQRAADLGLARGARVLTTHTWNTPADWVDALLVPLAVGGSLVILRNADTAGIERRLQQERATRIGS